MHILSFIAAITLMFFGVFIIATLKFIEDISFYNFFEVFNPFFMIFFGALIICSVFGVRIIVDNILFI